MQFPILVLMLNVKCFPGIVLLFPFNKRSLCPFSSLLGALVLYILRRAFAVWLCFFFGALVFVVMCICFCPYDISLYWHCVCVPVVDVRLFALTFECSIELNID